MISHRMHTVLVAVFVLGSAGSAVADVSKEACIESHSKGQDARDQGKLSLARKLFLTCAQSSCPALVQGDCARFADDLTRMQPTLTFAARDGNGADLPDTTVYVDDVLTATRLDDGKAYDVDPGRHVIKLVHGGKDQSVTIVVGAGEKSRAVAVRFGEASPVAKPITVAAIPAATQVTHRVTSTTTHPTGAKVAIIVGGVLTVGGGALGLVGLSRVPANCTVATHQCAAPPDDPSFATASSAIRLSNIGFVTAGLGVVAIAGGFVWYLQGTKTTRNEKLIAAPWITTDGAGLAAMGRF